MRFDLNINGRRQCAEVEPELRTVAGREVACHYAESSLADAAPSTTAVTR